MSPFSSAIGPRQRLLAIVAFLVSSITGGPALAAVPLAPEAILPELRSFQQTGSVLYVAAHPDDENTQLITYLARGRGYRTAYLSVTRGDGGQNVLSGDLREKLGVARTQELLAARRLDGGRQFFTRAVDFGFSKDAAETLRVWDRQAVLGDVVRVIRTFRPDVIVTRFSPVPGRTHGHHTSSAILATEAFKLAGDPNAFPEQLDYLQPWQPKRILRNGGAGVEIEFDSDEEVLGRSLAELAGYSRGMHKTQGFSARVRGGMRTESFSLLDGEPATNDIMDGIDTSWARFPGGAEIGPMIAAVIDNFNPAAPSTSVASLLEIHEQLAKLPADRLLEEKRQQLDRIIQACLGLKVETVVASAEVVPGETLELKHSAALTSATEGKWDGSRYIAGVKTLQADMRADTFRAAASVQWIGLRYPGSGREFDLNALTLNAGSPASLNSTQTIPESTPLTQPYWLREEGTVGMFQVDEPRLIGQPENPPVFPIEYIFDVGGEQIVVTDEPTLATDELVAPEMRRHLQVIPPGSVSFAYDVALFGPGQSQSIAVDVTAHRPETSGTVAINAPAGWQISPAQHRIVPGTDAMSTRYTFDVTAPAQPTIGRLTATIEVNGRRYDNQHIEINYDHIPRQLLQPPARLKAVCLDLAIRGHNIGYVPGAGDDIPASLEQMGYSITTLSEDDFVPEKLNALDAVVIGIRALNVRDNLRDRLPALFEFVKQGGNVVMQYNTARGISSDGIAPYPLNLSGDRVTNEDAVITVLAPDHPALNTPNKIGPADFEDWVQERGLYFPNRWDEHFTALISCHDTGEEPMDGSLLVARYGEGYFVYTGLSFFRQLPAGVPGAYRLFANLVSLGR